VTAPNVPPPSPPAPPARAGWTFTWIVVALGLAALLPLEVGVRWVVVVSLPGMLLLWPVGRGQRWARWLVATAGAVAGVVALALGTLAVDSSDSLPKSRALLASGVLLLLSAGTLFASARIDSLGRPSTTLTWLEVASATKRPTRHLTFSHRWFTFLSVWRRLTAGCAAISVGVVWLGLLVLGWVAVDAATDGLSHSHGPSGLMFGMTAAVIYLIALAIPIAVILLLALPVALAWENPIRFLLLRPFNRSALSRALVRVIKRQLAPLGHCYTLADADIRVSPWTHVPAILGPVALLAFGQRRILYPRDLAALARSMSHTFRRNLNWHVGLSGLFAVACSDSGWRACVARAVDEVDVVILDCSGGGHGLEWELKHLAKAGVFPRTIVLADVERRAEVEQNLYALPANVRPTVTFYGPTGLLEKGTLFAAVMNAAQSARG